MSTAWIISFALLAVIVLFQFYLIHQLFKQHTRMNERLNSVPTRRAPELGGPKIGEFAPTIKANSIDEQPVELGGTQDFETFIAFASPDCKPCKSVFPTLVELERPQDMRMVVVARGNVERDHEGISFFRGHVADKDIPLVISMDVIEQFNMKLYPSFLLLDKQGQVIAKDTLNNVKMLESFGLKEKL